MGEDLLERARSVAALHYDLARSELGADVLGVWLVGSAILADLTPDSDIDTVTLTTHPVETEEHAAIVRAHGGLAHAFPGLRHDTTYLSLATLALAPREGMVTPFSVDGELRLEEPCGEVHAVTWYTLPHALPAAGGIRPAEVHIHTDRAAAEQHSRANLQTYWADQADQVRGRVRDRDPVEELASGQVVLWLVLGAARLAAFLAGMRTHGPVPSKSEAGRWVAHQVPAHADLARRSLRARHGHAERFTVADARSASDLVTLLAHGHG